MSDQNLDNNSSPLDPSAQTLEEIRKMHGSMRRELAEFRRTINGWLVGILVVGITIAVLFYASLWIEYGPKLCGSCGIMSPQASCNICKGTGFTLSRTFFYPAPPVEPRQ